MTTLIDVLDTAVKVGLGALVSGLTTYFVTRRSHSHEISKTLAAERRDLIKECMSKLERCTSILNENVALVRDVFHGGEPDKDGAIRRLAKEVTSAYNLCREARSLALLAGQPDLGSLIDKYGATIEALYQLYDRDGAQFGSDEIEQLRNSRGEVKRQILDMLPAMLDAIYRGTAKQQLLAATTDDT